MNTGELEQSNLQLAQSKNKQLFQQELKVCSICLFMRPPKEFATVGCQHYFCQECLTSHVQAQLQEYQLIKCAQEGCEHVLDHSPGSIYHRLENGLKRRIDTILSNFTRMLSIKKCKKCKEGLLIQSLQEQKPIYFCEKCHEKHCYNCCKLIHRGRQSCISEEEVVLPENCQMCRKCQTIVERVMGCSHIRCLCGFDFCFECGYHWDATHICEYKIYRRQGISKVCCGLAKAIGIVFVFLAAVIFVVLAVLAICLLSSIIGGALIWIKVVSQCFQLKDSSNMPKIQDSNINFKPTSLQNLNQSSTLVKISNPRITLHQKSKELSVANNESQLVKFPSSEDIALKPSEAQPQRQTDQRSYLQLLLFILVVMALPLFLVVFGFIGFFVPFVNLCYDGTIILKSNPIKQIIEEAIRWFDLFFMI